MLEITVIADGDLGLVAMMTHVTPATKDNVQKATIDKSMIQNWKLKMVKQRESVVSVFRSSEVNTSTKKLAKENEGRKEKGFKKSNYRVRTTVEIHLPFSIFALNYFKNIMII